MTAAYAPEAYVFGSPENHDLLEAESNELLHFGHRFPAPNGGSTWLDDRGNPDPSHGIQTWITCRMAHVYTLGAIHGEPDAEELVDKALDGLRGPLHDDVNGGWYPSITADGTPEAGKVCYTHAFVILAATSATLIGRPGATELLADALDTANAHFW
ncbi:AGE family epimerase/isomerase, partial [Bifidobacterium pullorum]|uniref:AGE family epimerase/isomerase n=1 Tax=Bifidobacterium pullorum TaxID=78448 RepID=UPI00307C6BBF